MSTETNISILEGYKEKCNVLKQIHSNKKDIKECWNYGITVVTIIASILLTTAGFADKNILYELFMPNQDKTEALKYFDFFFNCLVLFFLIISVLNLILRLPEKSFEHNRAIIMLSELGTDINELLVGVPVLSDEKITSKIASINFRYDIIINVLPAHSDKDFLRGKKDYYIKKNKSRLIDEKFRK